MKHAKKYNLKKKKIDFIVGSEICLILIFRASTKVCGHLRFFLILFVKFDAMISF